MLLVIVGDFHAAEVAKKQPTKFAAMESIRHTQKAILYNIIVIPDPKNERNLIELIGIPKLLSFLAF